MDVVEIFSPSKFCPLRLFASIRVHSRFKTEPDTDAIRLIQSTANAHLPIGFFCIFRTIDAIRNG
jgi:hypothetical protein